HWISQSDRVVVNKLVEVVATYEPNRLLTNESARSAGYNPGFPFWHPELQQYTPHWLVCNRSFALQTPARRLAATCAPSRWSQTGHLDLFPIRFLGHLAIPPACFPRFSSAG